MRARAGRGTWHREYTCACYCGHVHSGYAGTCRYARGDVFFRLIFIEQKAGSERACILFICRKKYSNVFFGSCYQDFPLVILLYVCTLCQYGNFVIFEDFMLLLYFAIFG